MTSLKNILNSVVPDVIEDKSQKTTDFKLALGATTAILLIVGAFSTLTGFFTLTTEVFQGIQITNASIMLILGVAVVGFTLTKVGVQK